MTDWALMIREMRAGILKTDEEIPELPAPEVLARPAAAGEIPKAAKDILKLATAEGWTTEASYARGPWIDADDPRKFAYIVDSMLVRFRRGGQAAVACWVAKPLKKSDYGFAFAYAGPPVRKLKSTELRALLKWKDDSNEPTQ